MLAVVVAVFTLGPPAGRKNSFPHTPQWAGFLMFCKTMIFINSAINPILYNVMSIKGFVLLKREPLLLFGFGLGICGAKGL
ncbi:hypothetical protein TNIN_431851 [Trichonephila inaurata madagascariensis]|uniref:G-protein coupled receptors family 1 profile domain-containing protein n=1 Tax=Trichonephila inaurata madagascariensis TaxID=2747483 RepID=A0A8X7C075_9ARAC|nr:hypothetical protein TNIN_431851 [Trichonephila inaurata madagascariensis]